MNKRNQKIYSALAILMICFLGTSAWLVWRYRTSLKPSTSAQLFFPQEPFFLQSEPGLEKIKIGPNTETLASHGSATLSLSMALYAMGWQIVPPELAALLLKENAYKAIGEPKWYAVTAITGGRIEVEIPTSPNRNLIHKALEKGQPVLAEVEGDNQKKHWVFIVGTQGFDLLVKDPMANEQQLKLLSQYPGLLKNIRILKKRGQWSL